LLPSHRDHDIRSADKAGPHRQVATSLHAVAYQELSTLQNKAPAMRWFTLQAPPSVVHRIQ
jgi:hypothetical protein